MELLFFLGRILYGGFFVMMGLNHFMKVKMLSQYAASKDVSAPTLSVLISGLLIFLGGLGVVLGVYIELSVLFLAVFLIVVSYKMHNFWAIEDPQERMTQMINFMKNMAFLGAALMLLMIPTPWPFGL